MILRLIGFGLGLGGVLFSVHLMRRYFRSRRARGLSVTRGEIVRSEPVKWRTFVDDYGPREGSSVRFLPRIEYRYLVDRLWFECSTVSMEREPDPEPLGKAKRRCARYPQGARVDVYYRPESPQAAWLEVPRAPGRTEALTGLLVVLIGIVLASGFLTG